MTHREFILTVKKEIKAQQGKKTWTFKKPGQMMIFDQANFERLHSGENFNHEVSNNESISQLEAFVRYNKSDFEKEVQVGKSEPESTKLNWLEDLTTNSNRIFLYDTQRIHPNSREPNLRNIGRH